MTVLILILAFVFGTVIGSFLNVVSLRFNTGAGLHGRSMCMSCGKQLVWYELVPLFSFLAQGGACRKCRCKISWQYPLVEALTGLLFMLVIWRFPLTDAPSGLFILLELIMASLLVVITAYDIKHKIIPDLFVYSFATFAFASLFIGGSSWFHVPSMHAMIAGPLLALPFALIWLVSKGTWMGLGDAKLTLGIGWLLGINAGANALVMAFWIGALVSVIWMLATRHKLEPRTEIPFGPYLVLGMYIVLLTGLKVMDLGVLKEIVSH